MKVSDETIAALCDTTKSFLDKGNQIIYYLKCFKGTYVRSKKTDKTYKVIPGYFESFISWHDLDTLHIGFELIPKEPSKKSIRGNPVEILGFFEFIKLLNNGDIFPVEGIEEPAKL